MGYEGPHDGCGPQCEYGCGCYCHRPAITKLGDLLSMASRMKEIADFAREQLAKYPPVEYVPDWHPYFWLGVLEAVERMKEPKA